MDEEEARRIVIPGKTNARPLGVVEPGASFGWLWPASLGMQGARAGKLWLDLRRRAEDNGRAVGNEVSYSCWYRCGNGWRVSRN